MQLECILESDRRNKLDESVISAEDDHIVDSQTEVDSDGFEKVVHQRDHLHNDLVTPQIVGLLVNDFGGLVLSVFELQQHRLGGTGEHRGRVWHEFFQVHIWLLYF